MRLALLSGGSGGAKLARGLRDLCNLSVIANTGDDIEIYGSHVCPDPDLITYWLADMIDERGWGVVNDTFQVMDGLRDLGREVWFNLGDRDLAVCLERKRSLDGGASLTVALERLGSAVGARAMVIPMSDDSMPTRIHTAGGKLGLQEFLIRERAEPEIQHVEFKGAAAAAPSPRALEAIESAEAIVIGPSNPIISIGPILAVPGMREALRAATAPVIAVSPLVGGKVLKGPTAACLEWAGLPVSDEGIAQAYDGLLDGMVADQRVDGLPVLQCDTLMDTLQARELLGARVLAFAQALAA